MFTNDLRDVHVEYSVTNVEVTCYNYMLLAEEFAAVFVEHLLKLIYFVLKTLKILTGRWDVSCDEVEMLKLKSEDTTLLTELSFLKILKSRYGLKP